MKTHPDFDIEIGTALRPVHATEVAGSERDRLYRAHPERYPIFAGYEQRLERTVLVMRLSPRS